MILGQAGGSAADSFRRPRGERKIDRAGREGVCCRHGPPLFPHEPANPPEHGGTGARGRDAAGLRPLRHRPATQEPPVPAGSWRTGLSAGL
ncbi:hypothetical protein HMPREF9946_04274 [Acetobacteraceae bacterium AT-5844]|nr:hypothetical protein HMPREF9946_04274 [Acetobacteraceae bacterium AT-5844]